MSQEKALVVKKTMHTSKNKEKPTFRGYRHCSVRHTNRLTAKDVDVVYYRLLSKAVQLWRKIRINDESYYTIFYDMIKKKVTTTHTYKMVYWVATLFNSFSPVWLYFVFTVNPQIKIEFKMLNTKYLKPLLFDPCRMSCDITGKFRTNTWQRYVYVKSDSRKLKLTL